MSENGCFIQCILSLLFCIQCTDLHFSEFLRGPFLCLFKLPEHILQYLKPVIAHTDRFFVRICKFFFQLLNLHSTVKFLSICDLKFTVDLGFFLICPEQFFRDPCMLSHQRLELDLIQPPQSFICVLLCLRHLGILFCRTP